jgi:cytochrome c2
MRLRRLRALLALAALAILAGCGKAPATSGDRDNGRLLLRQFGCGQCHRIPGVADAQGDTGPPLARVGERAYLGGVLPNSPENLARFIRHPQRFDPRTTMPDLGVTDAHARDMAAWLLEAR